VSAAAKIGKLLAKAEGTDNPHEAEAFMRKAEALMIQEGIDEAMARRAGGANVRPEEIVERVIRLYVAKDTRTWDTRTSSTYVCKGACGQELEARRFPTTKDRYLRGVECRSCRDARPKGVSQAETNAYNRAHVEGFFRVVRHLGVRGYRRGDSLFYVVGFESDVARAELLLRSLHLQAVAAMWSWWKAEGTHRYWGDSERVQARKDFIYDFHNGAATRLRQETQTQVDATPGAALALRDKASELGAHMDTLGLAKGRPTNLGGSAAGFAAGREANLGGNGLGSRKAVGS
jgi:hypothetical protein